MALLKIINGPSAGSTFPLRAGPQKVGRREENDLAILDASVSGTHCEISLDASGALLVRDLGSTNGTYLEGQKVLQALVQPGQRLRLGDLEMLFEGDAAVAAPPPPIKVAAAAPVRLNVAGAAPVAAVAPVAVHDPAPSVAGPDDCANHPGIGAKFVCTRCGKKACADCTKQQTAGMSVVDFCLACNGRMKKLGDVAKEQAAAASAQQSFGSAITSSFSFPFRGNGLILLITGTIFYGIMDWILGAAVGIMSLVVFVLVYGYLLAYLQKIVVTSAQGEDDPPEWPEVSDIGSDIVQPFFQFLVTSIVAFGPSVYVSIKMGAMPGMLVSLLGSIYFPMALLAVAMSDSYSGLNPIFVLSSIMKVIKPYIVTCFAFWLLSIMWNDVGDLVAEIDIPVLPQFVYWFLLLIALMICCRILGKLYFLNRHKLGWGL